MPFFVEFVVQSVMYVLFNFLVVCMVYPHFSIALFCILGKCLYVIDFDFSTTEVFSLLNM